MDLPLFQLATKFYKSKENLIKTSARTIILQIFAGAAQSDLKDEFE